MAKRKARAADKLPAGGQPSTIETWDVARLRHNPRQDENFHPLAAAELARLAEDMERNGQQTPIEVTPDGRIIDGHQRWRAARLLGSTTVRVVVRHDLAGDEAAIERRMIEANLNRRQLDLLDWVRLARRMLELNRKLEPGGLSRCAGQDLRDQIGEMLGMSGRNVQRYLNILNAPMAIQRSFSGGEVSMKLAERVAGLDRATQLDISAAIAAGGAPATVVAAHMPATAPAAPDPDRGYAALLQAATHAIEALDGREGWARGGLDLDAEIEVLERAGATMNRLIARLSQLKRLKQLRSRAMRIPEAQNKSIS